MMMDGFGFVVIGMLKRPSPHTPFSLAAISLVSCSIVVLALAQEQPKSPCLAPYSLDGSR